MDNKKEYIIVYEDGFMALENEINRKFEDGYLPDGDIVVSPNGDRNNSSTIFIQRMNKRIL